MKDLGERHLTDDNSFLRQTGKEFRITPGELEESGRSWEKTCGLGPTEEITPLERDVEQIDDAPEQLKYLNEVTT